MRDPDPRFAHCPECAGGRVNCPRCDGEGIVEEDATAESHVRVRLARCENYLEKEDRPCTGLLAFQPGDRQAACSRCQAWCGVLVADYIETLRAISG